MISMYGSSTHDIPNWISCTKYKVFHPLPLNQPDYTCQFLLLLLLPLPGSSMCCAIRVNAYYSYVEGTRQLKRKASQISLLSESISDHQSAIKLKKKKIEIILRSIPLQANKYIVSLLIGIIPGLKITTLYI